MRLSCVSTGCNGVFRELIALPFFPVRNGLIHAGPFCATLPRHSSPTTASFAARRGYSSPPKLAGRRTLREFVSLKGYGAALATSIFVFLRAVRLLCPRAVLSTKSRKAPCFWSRRATVIAEEVFHVIARCSSGTTVGTREILASVDTPIFLWTPLHFSFGAVPFWPGEVIISALYFNEVFAIAR